MLDGVATPESWATGLRVDLGCGEAKEDGFIGVDRYRGAKVDIVTDLDAPLPFETSSVDHVRLSHSLEHVRDLPTFMTEIYRLIKDRGLVTVIAPYAETTLDLSNPYHLNGITEQTARFFTDSPTSPLPEHWYGFPFSEPWGLLSSDNGWRQFDFRLVRCEFFPFSDVAVDPERLWEMRRLLRNVVHEVVLQLVAVKSPMTDAEQQELMGVSGFPEPRYLAAHRAAPPGAPSPLLGAMLALPERLDALEGTGHALQRSWDLVDDRLDALESSRDDARDQLARALQELTERVRQLELQQQTIVAAQTASISARPGSSGRLRRFAPGKALVARGIYPSREDFAGTLPPDYGDLIEGAVLATGSPGPLGVVGTPVLASTLTSFALPGTRRDGELTVALLADRPPASPTTVGTWDVVAGVPGQETVVCAGTLRIGPDINSAPLQLGYVSVPDGELRLRFVLDAAASDVGLRAFVVARIRRFHVRSLVIVGGIR